MISLQAAHSNVIAFHSRPDLKTQKPVEAYTTLPICRGLFFPNNSQEAPIARPLGRRMGVFREILVWPKFYLQI